MLFFMYSLVRMFDVMVFIRQTRKKKQITPVQVYYDKTEGQMVNYEKVICGYGFYFCEKVIFYQKILF